MQDRYPYTTSEYDFTALQVITTRFNIEQKTPIKCNTFQINRIELGVSV